MSDERDMLEMVERYQATVLRYESLHRQINALIQQFDGDSEKMSAEARIQYQDLARQRDEAMNELRWLEQELLDE